MFTGYTPFTDLGTITNDLQIYDNILNQTIEFPANFPSAPAHFIRKLMDPDQTKRCGWATGSLKDVRRHRWFRGFDWEALEKEKMEAPFRPEVKGDSDISNFNVVKNEKRYNFHNDSAWDGHSGDWDASW